MKPSKLYKAFREAQKTAYRKVYFNDQDEAISPSEWATDVINGCGGQVSWDSVKAGFYGFRDCISVYNHTGKKVVIKKPTRVKCDTYHWSRGDYFESMVDNVVFDNNDLEIIEEVMED